MININKNLATIAGVVLFSFILFSSCKKDDYLKGGTLHNSKVNMTTYDYLKANPQGLFDTLLLLIDKSGSKDLINQSGTTFFVPTDYSLSNYLGKRVAEEQRIDPFRKYTIDSMFKYDLNKFKDSIKVYIVNGTTAYSTLTKNGAIFPTLKTGTNAVVSFEETRDPDFGFNSNISNVPQIVYFTLLLKTLTPPIVANEITSEDGIRVRVQTSGIETTTGMVQVLQNGHTLFFKK